MKIYKVKLLVVLVSYVLMDLHKRTDKKTDFVLKLALVRWCILYIPEEGKSLRDKFPLSSFHISLLAGSSLLTWLLFTFLPSI